MTTAGASNTELLLRLWHYARDDRRWLWLALSLVPLTSLAGLAQPYLVKEAIDGPILAALSPQQASAESYGLVTIAMAFLAAAVAEFLIRGLHLLSLQKLGYRLLQRLRKAIYRHLLAQDAAFYDSRKTGSLLTRATNDVESLGEVLTFGIVGIVGDVINIVAIVTLMVVLNVKLTLVSLVIAPLVVLIVNFFRRRLRHYSAEIRLAIAGATGFFAEALAGHKVVQIHGRKEMTVSEYKSLNYRYLRAYHRANWYDASLYAIMDGVSGLCIALLIWYGSGLHLEGSVSLGLLVAFIQYIQRLFIPVRELSGKVATIERAMAAAERIFALLDVDRSLTSGSHAPKQVLGRLAIRGLNFRYTQEGPQVLDTIDLDVSAGEVVALVGPTGSGKSTLGKLITRMYPCAAETITLDDVAIERWRLDSLRRAVATVQQDVFLFSGTIAENISLGRRTIDDATIARAIADAQLTERVERLGGAGALLSEHGANLSAGERQLLSIARVLAQDPALVILDEATASIDPITERALQQAIERVFEGRSVIAIAHRLSTVRRADRIAVIDGGRIVEQGNHEQLMARQGLYARLVETTLRVDGA